MRISKGLVEELFNADQISHRCRELGDEIGLYYSQIFMDEGYFGGTGTLGVVPVLNGAMQFCSKLLEQSVFPFQTQIIPCFARSYRGIKKGALDFGFPSAEEMPKHILVVEDIIDTGDTVSQIVDWFWKNGHTPTVCSLLKKSQQKFKIDAKFWTGFHCPDKFVVGFGMDYRGFYRHYSSIHIFDEEKINA